VLLDINPQPGAWAAAGTALARAPAISELREPGIGEDLQVDEHGHATFHIVDENFSRNEAEDLVLKTAKTNAAARRRSSVGKRPSARRRSEGRDGQPLTTGVAHTATVPEVITEVETSRIGAEKPILVPATQVVEEKVSTPFPPFSQEELPNPEKHSYAAATKHLLVLLWKFVKTPTGFLFTIYMLNIIAWGGMLFLLELKAAPAMDHPNNGDDDSSPRKEWLEIDSQILNALFCVTGFGLAPWRFRDAYFATMARWGGHGVGQWGRRAMRRVTVQYHSWFRPPGWYVQVCEEGEEEDPVGITATGKRAQSTALWKLDFVVWMMVANTGFQVVLSFYMWHYDRIQRPGWATGTFIGCGCGVALLSGLMVWWEGRKVKKVEGLKVKVVRKETEVDEKNPVKVREEEKLDSDV